MVSAFDQPDSSTPTVRVVIQRASGVAPTVTQNKSNMEIDFDGEDAALWEVPWK